MVVVRAHPLTHHPRRGKSSSLHFNTHLSAGKKRKPTSMPHNMNAIKTCLCSAPPPSACVTEAWADNSMTGRSAFAWGFLKDIFLSTLLKVSKGFQTHGHFHKSECRITGGDFTDINGWWAVPSGGAFPRQTQTCLYVCVYMYYVCLHFFIYVYVLNVCLCRCV